MSLLLAIHSYPGANDTVRRHWPHYLAAGADQIIGIGTSCGGCQFPPGCPQHFIGGNSYISGDKLPRRLIDTFAHMLNYKGFDEFEIIEYDTIFFKPIPRPIIGCAAHLAGYNVGTKAPRFYHNPWMADRDTAERIVKHGKELLAAGDYDHPSPDVFFGYLCDKFNIPVRADFMHEYSRNSLDIPHQLHEAKIAVQNGACCVHGVKSPDQLNYLLT